jgi:aldehyde dehydrogenase (NAD+)
MLIKNKVTFTNLISDLNVVISTKKAELFKLNQEITLDTNYWILKDYKTVTSYLKNYINNHYRINLINRIKSKGKILIILSYNEPFILSIIPILNALAVGNEVTLKSSRGSEEFINTIWQKSGIIKKYDLKLNIVFRKTHGEIDNLIKSVRAVYFFGSYKVAQNLSKICGEHYVEFYPEVESADIKIFNKKLSDIKNDVLLTLKDSFSHSGQTCQRIQGVFVNDNLYKDYLRMLKKEFILFCQSKNIARFISHNYISNREDLIKLLMLDIKKSKPIKIIQIKELPLLIIKPQVKSDFINNAYFLPVLWILPFRSNTELINFLNLRKFFQGLNIHSDSNNFIYNIINNTKFTRYTINRSHVNIGAREGWGASWPSGFSGYKSWLEHFSDGYTIISKS